MSDLFKKLVSGINPPANSRREWFSVPANHQYQGYVRITNLGTEKATYRLAGVAWAGSIPTTKDYEAYNTNIGPGDIHDLTMDLNELETLVVWASSSNVVFNYRGLDIDAD